MEIKVCGITSVEQLRDLHEAGVHYAGMRFHDDSPRDAREKLKGKQKEIADIDISRIGVFKNAEEKFIRQVIEDYSLTGIQLDGDETPAFCARFMDTVNVVKTFRIDEKSDVDAITNAYHHSCNYYLFDTGSAESQVKGRKYDWTKLENAPVNKLFFLGGDIGPEDAVRMAEFYHPFLYAFDLNTRFETSTGVKNIAKIREFVAKISDTTHDPDVKISLNT